MEYLIIEGRKVSDSKEIAQTIETTLGPTICQIKGLALLID